MIVGYVLLEIKRGFCFRFPSSAIFELCMNKQKIFKVLKMGVAKIDPKLLRTEVVHFRQESIRDSFTNMLQVGVVTIYEFMSSSHFRVVPSTIHPSPLSRITRIWKKKISIMSTTSNCVSQLHSSKLLSAQWYSSKFLNNCACGFVVTVTSSRLSVEKEPRLFWKNNSKGVEGAVQTSYFSCLCNETANSFGVEGAAV